MEKHVLRTLAAASLALLVMVLMVTPVGAQNNGEALVKAIEIQGNVHVDTSLIQSAITHTQLEAVLTEENVLQDLHAIYDLGYFYDASAKFDPAPGGVKVVFVVDENPIVRDIRFIGATKAPVDQFKRQMNTQPGQVMNVNTLMDDIRRLPDWVLLEYGIALRPVDLRADEDGFIEVDIAETIIAEIRLEGNEKTQDFVIERELTIKPGDILDMNEINRSLRRILMLGFFDEINRSFADGDSPDEQIMTIQLTERKTGTATGGIGYGTNDGWMIFGEIAEDNFLGRGQRINASVEFSTKRQTYELGFYEPYIDASGTSLGVNVYHRVTTVGEDEDERRTTGGDITLGRPLGEFTRGRLTLKAQNNRYTGDVFDDYNSRTVGAGITTNTTDHPFFPTAGFKNIVSLEVGTSLFGGDAVFSKMELEHSRYFEIRDGGFVFAVRGLGGRVLTGELRESELYRAGGDPRMRGYSRNDQDLIGDKMLIMNAEFRFPIVERVQGVVFTDWGNAWRPEESIDLSDLKNSYGLGVRLDTPLGLLRLDYGWGLDAETETRQGQFIFGFGQTF